ncbi:hypothetical protein IRJ41_010973 [Triplophysa rosa]|uniref:HAT C-terminal dimerisation domain-containing protein n=1 Tax=Triplophysa rosa TaxID=992332 RepID=A0A9W8C1N4_TRIRA|nr:hypothetical protein IRJ41_010973 [Triplophysa rosa]
MILGIKPHLQNGEEMTGKSKYFAVEFDCTPDISKQEQASVIIRYIHTDESKKASVQESFVDFTAVKDTTGQGLAETLIEVIEKNLGLELVNCRGQSYDNGSNMRGIQKGVQALILEKNPEALFIPCSHSLNLLLCDVASSNRECLTFFGTLQRLYTIFSSSVKRWNILKEFIEITLKPLSDTRWEAKLDSAKSLSEEIVRMEFLVCLIIWYDILAEITHVSKALQAADVSLDTAILLVSSLKDFLVQYRKEGLKKSLSIARSMAAEFNSSTEFRRKRLRKQKQFHDETFSYNEDKDPEMHFRCGVFNVIVDTAIQELSDRFKNIGSVSNKFSFLIKMETMTKEKLEESVTRYALTTNDISRDIIQEIYPASRILKGHKKAIDKLNFILQENLDKVFPNLTVALRVFLTMPLTVASAERSFSKLKLIKTYLRSTMNNDRLSQLAIVSIENSLARSTSFDEILEKWASTKARHVKV